MLSEETLKPGLQSKLTCKNKALARKLLISEVYNRFMSENPNVKSISVDDRNKIMKEWIAKIFAEGAMGAGGGTTSILIISYVDSRFCLRVTIILAC